MNLLAVFTSSDIRFPAGMTPKTFVCVESTTGEDKKIVPIKNNAILYLKPIKSIRDNMLFLWRYRETIVSRFFSLSSKLLEGSTFFEGFF